MRIVLNRKEKKLLNKLLRVFLITMALGGVIWGVIAMFLMDGEFISCSQASWQIAISIIVSGTGVGGMSYVERV